MSPFLAMLAMVASPLALPLLGFLFLRWVFNDDIKAINKAIDAHKDSKRK